MYKLLIIDDEDIIREGISKIIEISNTRFQVVGEAGNGKLGLELALKLNPDLIIADIKMPIMDGLEMIDKIKERASHVKFIVLSAHTDFDFTRHAIKSGVIDYLKKPINRFELIELLKLVEKLIDNDRTSTEPIVDHVEIEVGDKSKNGRKTIQMAKEYINSNFFNNIGLESVATYVGMNTNYFSSLFKKETGENFIDYLTKVRIEKAKTLLVNPKLKIYEICQIVGYYSTKHFARIFRDMVGMTPSEFRENQK